MQSVSQQAVSLVLTIGIGFLTGIIYDIYRVTRGIWQPKRLGTLIGDFFFWVIITILVFSLLLLGNWGEVRVYVFLGLALGFLMYIKYCSLKGQWLISKMFFAIYKTLKFIWRVVTWPFVLIYKIILVPLGFLATGLYGLGEFIKKILIKIKGKTKRAIKKLLALFQSKKPKDEE